MSNEIKGALELADAVQRFANQSVVKAPEKGYRTGTKLPTIVHNFWLRGGGMGDRICNFPALVWMAYTRPHYLGRIWIAPSLVEFAENIIAQTGRRDWKVYDIRTEHIWEDKRYEDGTRVTGRGMTKMPDGTKIAYVGATGAGGHLVQMGFVDHAGRYNAPFAEDRMPLIDFSGWSDPSDWKWKWQGLARKNFVVFTTGAVSPSRSVPGKLWNPIIHYVKHQNLIPVFLGKSEINDIEIPLKVTFEDGCDYKCGIDLRDQTTVMEAAYLMEHAAAVIGLDNGLIQLASCTKANIVCAYNIVDPKDRVPKRLAGRWATVYLNEDELSCTGCQTNMGGIAPPHNFKYCLYADKRCIDLLFEDDGVRFRRALNQVLD